MNFTNSILLGCLVQTMAWLAPTTAATASAGGSVDKTAPKTIYTFDARSLNRLDLREAKNARRLWDTLHLLAAVQGLANVDAPRFYLLYCSEFGVQTDEFWLRWLRGEDGWLKATEVINLATVEDVLKTFDRYFRGLVIYDELTPATSNLASTAAGVDQLLPVRFDRDPDSLYTMLLEKLKIAPVLWLVNQDGSPKFIGRGLIPDINEPSSGSAKIDVYRWGLKKYLLAGRCNPLLAGYYLDCFWLKVPRRAGPEMHTLSNQDYFIARQAFFFDLSPWADEAPTDDPGQSLGADRSAFLAVMNALYQQAGGRILKIGGFIPWPYKYTSHSQPPGQHEGVPTEWEFGRLISQFNGYMEADAAGLGGMANASFFAHYPLPQRMAQPNSKPGRELWQRRGFVSPDNRVAPKFYVGHYVGDYDAPSWLYKAVPAFFSEPNRGAIPLGWAFTPNLADRAPQALMFAYRHASTNDFFIAGDSGAGYLNVRALTIRPESQLPSGLTLWQRHCERYYRQWDMTISGFVLDGSAGAATELEYAAYKSFSPDGIGTHFDRAPRWHAGISTCPERDLPDSAEKAAELIYQKSIEQPGQPGFLWARSILKSPQWYVRLANSLNEKHPQHRVEFVDPYTFFGLIAIHLPVHNPTPRQPI